jgi:hypothetical protein
MKALIASPIVALALFCGVGAAYAAGVGDQIKVEMESSSIHPGMDPGKYVCGAGHLHIKGTVQNLTAAPVGQIKVAGTVFDADGKVLGTATASTKQTVLNPNDKAAVDLEFLKVTGPLVKQVKSQELTVVAVAPKP